MGKLSSSPCGPITPMTTLFGYTKGTITSECQAALNRFKKGTKRDASAFLRMTSITTPSRDPYWLLSKSKVFMMLLTQTLILMMEISMINNSLKKNKLLNILYWLDIQEKRTSQGVCRRYMNHHF